VPVGTCGPRLGGRTCESVGTESARRARGRHIAGLQLSARDGRHGCSDERLRNEYRTPGSVMTVFNSIQPEPAWRLEFFSGQAGQVLLAESVGAALLVVGAKEHVGIGRLVYGSVSH